MSISSHRGDGISSNGKKINVVVQNISLHACVQISRRTLSMMILMTSHYKCNHTIPTLSWPWENIFSAGLTTTYSFASMKPALCEWFRMAKTNRKRLYWLEQCGSVQGVNFCGRKFLQIAEQMWNSCKLSPQMKPASIYWGASYKSLGYHVR